MLAATIMKMIKDAAPADVRVANDAVTLISLCCNGKRVHGILVKPAVFLRIGSSFLARIAAFVWLWRCRICTADIV